ncbi:MAG TPA: polysaccharide deacetylase family protein [Candidatus Acidoferrum sp.]|nr:polysaccharide deacetylase family protein [Candidatus Acidoferrum sp.]
MSHLHWKRQLGRLSSLWPPASPRRAILLYHALGPLPPAVTVERFRAQLDWLATHAALVSLETLLTSPQTAGLQVALTFDDGYASLHDDVAPLLPQCGATVYVNSGRIDDSVRQASEPAQGHYPREHFLLWGEVKSLEQAGWIVGSHGVEHTDLTAVDGARVDDELQRSRAMIEARLQQPCAHFAYTWGRFTPQLQQRVKAAGYRSAASGLHGPLTVASDRFALPRIDVRADYELDDFIAAVSGAWDFLGYKQRLWRAFA